MERQSTHVNENRHKGLNPLPLPAVQSYPVIFFQLYSYENQVEYIIDPRFYNRLAWNGSKHTKDLQDGSIYILNVTFNDTGTYKCIFDRILIYSNYEYHTDTNKTILVHVVPRRKRRN